MKKFILAAAAIFTLTSFAACNDSRETLESLQAVSTTIEPTFVEHIRENSAETHIAAEQTEQPEVSGQTVQTEQTFPEEEIPVIESEDIFDDSFFDSAAYKYEYTSEASAENSDIIEGAPIYIKTPAVPEDAYEYALKMFSGISKSELVSLGFTTEEAKSAVMGDGYRIKAISENIDADNIFYFPVLCGGNFTAMMTVNYNGEQYGWQFGKDDSINVMNRLNEGVLKTSYENPAELYISKNATYCVLNEYVMVLSYSSSYNTDEIKTESEFLGNSRNNSSGSDTDIIVVYANKETYGIEQTFPPEKKQESNYFAAASYAEKKLSPDDFGGSYYDNDDLVLLIVNEENTREAIEQIKEKYSRITTKPCKFSLTELETVRAYLEENMNNFGINGLGIYTMENCVGIVTEQVSSELREYIDSLEDPGIIKIDIGKIIPV